MKSSAAFAGKSLKKEIKKKFPGVKFSVRSSTYTGGSSIRISWKNGPTEKEVKPLTYKYQKGHFNGMIDMYESTNLRDDIPQVKFVFCEREISDDILEKVEKELIEKYGIKNPDDNKEWFSKFGKWKQHIIKEKARELNIYKGGK